MKISQKYKIPAAFLLAVLIIGLLVNYLSNHNLAVLNPAGEIASKEKHLIIVATLLALVVIIPVYIMTAMIAWRYRETNHRAKYTPDWDHNVWLESIWWGIPCAIILVLSIITWNSSHALDPFRPLKSSVKPITVQVVALDWKWLFIYPDQRIATVNFVEFPEKTPVNFQITADAPMNSLWIPQLGSQIYAMPGMSSELHLMADGQGTYRGESANISGRGFSGMVFQAKSVSQSDFKQWLSQVRQSPQKLDQSSYQQLAKQSTDNPVKYYSYSQPYLYDSVLAKYMAPVNSQPVAVSEASP